MRKRTLSVAIIVFCFTIFAACDVTDNISSTTAVKIEVENSKMLLRDAVNTYIQTRYPNLISAVLAEASFGDKRVAIAWPVLKKDFSLTNGKNIDCFEEETCPYFDDDILLFSFINENGNWQPVQEFSELKYDKLEKLADFFGTEQYDLRLHSGTEDVAKILERLSFATPSSSDFSNMDPAKIVARIEEASGFFSFASLANDDTFSAIVFQKLNPSFAALTLKDLSITGNSASGVGIMTVGAENYENTLSFKHYEEGWKIEANL